MNIKQLQECGVVKKYNQGEFICFENEEGSTAFLLLQGRVEVKLSSFHDKPKQVAILEPGVIFGEMSLLENKPRTASVLAVSNQVSVLVIEKNNFIKILQTDPEIAYNLLRTMINRMESSLDRMKDINIPFIANFRRDKFYPQIKSMTKEQFETIICNDSAHAMRIARFLSHSLAEIDKEMSKRGFI